MAISASKIHNTGLEMRYYGLGKSEKEKKNDAQVPTQPSTRPENQKPPYTDAHTETKFIISS